MPVAKKSQEGSPLDSSEILKRKAAFDDYAHEEEGVEYWLAREIMKPLGYARWENFQEAIRRAAVSCEESKTPAQNHFRETTKTIPMPKGASRAISDFKLTRYACYLIAINGDPTKPEIALAQAYFAVMTRKQELIEQRMAELKRLQARHALSESEKQLSAIVFERDVDGPGFARIKSRGDAALFGGHDTRAMKRRLGVGDKGPKPLADVLDDVAIAAKQLANTMTSHNVEAHGLRGQAPIENEHVGNNVSVRSTLLERGIVPEDLPAAEDTKKLERRVKADERKLKGSTSGFLHE